MKNLLYITILLVATSLILYEREVMGEFPICTDGGDQGVPSISGNIVVWDDNGDIYGYDLNTLNKFVVYEGIASQNQAVVNGNLVVWRDLRNIDADIYGRYLTEPNEFIISTGSGESYPALSDDYIVWLDSRNGNRDIYAYDLLSKVEFPVCTNTENQMWPDISGNIVVWCDQRNGNFDIYGYDFSEPNEFAICTNELDQVYPAIYGNIVIWEDQRNGNSENGYNYDIYGYNLTTKTEFTICTNSARQEYPSISGNIVVWEDARNSNYDIYGYNLDTQTEFAICMNSANQQWTAISGDAVVWWDYRNGALEDGGDIYGAYVWRGHDECLQAFEVFKGTPYLGSNLIATGSDESDCGYNDTSDVWHYFVPEFTANYTISLCGSDYDTTLSIFDDCWSTEIACNDDHCGLQSELTLKATAGVKYLIRVAGYNAGTGDYILSVIGPDCKEPIKSDLNNDCKVDLLDLSIFATDWLKCNLVPEESCWGE